MANGFWSRIPCSRVVIRLTWCAAVALTLFPGPGLARAQNTTAEITGTVKDASGAVVPGVALTITNDATGQERHLVSGSDGNFVATALPVGTYSVKAELASFKTQVRKGIVLQVAEQARIDLVLEVGEMTEEVTVEASAPLLRTENAEVSEVIDNQRVTSLPLNGRQFVDLTLLSDNVFVSPRGTRGSALAQTGPAVLVAGQRAGHNMYYLDGVSVTDQYFNHLVASPAIDGIQEFNIQKSLYSPEFGGKASATVSAVTKSGTNFLHGGFYEFIRNNVFDARNAFDPAKIPPFRQNQFGGTLGGPIRKDKTFFFVDYEGFRVRQAVTQTFSVPTAQERSGNFTGVATVYDPLTTAANGSRTAFLDDTILAGRQDKAAVAFLDKIPLPNLPGQALNYLATPTLQNGYDQGAARLDHHLSEKDSFFGRLYIANFVEFQPLGSSLLNESLLPGFGYNLTTYTKSVALGETHVFSPSLVSEFRFGFLRVSGGQQSQNQGTNFAGLNGIQGVAPAANQTGYPSVSFSGAYTTAGDPGNLFSRRDNSFDFMENLSWVRANHSMKFGAYIFRLQFNPSESPNARGSFTFSPRYSSSAAGASDGNAFADFLLGFPSSAQAGVGPGGSEYGRSLWTHFYAQDDWRVTPTLSFNYGVRYEINSQMSDTQNRLSNIEVDRFVVASSDSGRINPLANPLLPQIPVPVVTSQAAGYPNTLQKPAYGRVAPRLGLAWNATSKTVVRAGWGLFYNQAAYNIQTALTENLPFYFNKSVNNISTAVVPTLTTESILAASANGTIGGSGLNYAYRPEFADSWSLNVQRMLSGGWLAQATYFGSHVSGADNSTFANVPLPGPGVVDSRRPNPLISGFRMIRWDGWSIYHSGTFSIERRFARGIGLNMNYTWSKSMDDASDVGSTFSETNIPQDVRNVRAERALSSFDHRQRLVFSYSYQLPLGKGHAFDPAGFAGKMVGGWTVNGLGSAQSGAPFTVILPGDTANIGAGPAQRPNLIGDPNADAPHTARQWFNTSAFQTPTQFTFGSAGRNVVLGDDEVNTDLSLIKDTPVGERAQAQFRFELFNLLNHTNFADVPGRTLGTQTFGSYSAAENPRQIQFALKLSF